MASQVSALHVLHVGSGVGAGLTNRVRFVVHRATGNGFIIEGTVQNGFPLKVRKSQAMQGYLKSTVTADVAEKVWVLAGDGRK
jgi:hypothetical protein